MHDHVLRGCRPVPLAHYLKALGILRLVTQQADPEVRGYWQDDRFVLRTVLDEEALVAFFLKEYSPTPLVSPWNGGSGFYAKEKSRAALDALACSPAPRFSEYRNTITTCWELLTECGLDEKPDKAEKRVLLEACRARLSDRAVMWLDAAYLAVGDNAKYPPLLGIGGCDGNMEFSRNFMERLTDLFDVQSGAARSPAHQLLEGALFELPTSGLFDSPVGQFLPGCAGGANATTGFSRKSLINPWDYLLMLEGTVAFSAASVKRYESDPDGALAYPFMVRQVRSGYGSAATDDEKNGRDEMWMPLWNSPTRFVELAAIFGEGRVRVSGRPARNGVDAARAVASLGVDRGLAAFQRVGFQRRNGLSYFATPLGRHEVSRNPALGLLGPLDSWLDRFRMVATADNAPAAVARDARHVDEAIMALCQRGDRLDKERLFIALGASSRQLGRRFRWASDPERRLPPLPSLSSDWLAAVDDGSVEFRLAVAAASTESDCKDRSKAPTRCLLEPVRVKPRGLEWSAETLRHVVAERTAVDLFNSILSRRIVEGQMAGRDSYKDHARVWADAGDVAAFVEGRVDDNRLFDLFCAAALVDWSKVKRNELALERHAQALQPDAVYGVLKLANAEFCDVPLVPAVHRLAASGQGGKAVERAVRRLRASGIAVLKMFLTRDGNSCRRIAAAILFPLGPNDTQKLISRLCPVAPPSQSTHLDLGDRYEL